jgi:hypothetical protein
MTLVGQPLLSGCLASLICILIISQTLRFVKTFFNFFMVDNAYSISSVSAPLSHRSLSQWFPQEGLCILIISHFWRFVKHFFFGGGGGFEPPL